jgi:predicted metalloendopeptidase
MTVSGLDLANFDRSIRPQDDLYRFVNGGWFATHEIPEDKSRYGSFIELRDKSEAAIRLILEEASANPKPGVSQKIGDLYASFLDEAKINELGAAPIAHELQQVEQVADRTQLTELMGAFFRIGLPGLFGVFIDNDSKNPDRYICHLAQSGLGLPDEAYYRDDKYAEIRDAYVAHISQMFALTGFDNVDAIGRAIFAFETELAKHHWNVVDTRDADKTYNLKTYDELQAASPNFAFNHWMKGAQLGREKFAEVISMTPSFFEGMSKLFEATDLETLKNWLRWQVLRGFGPFLNDEIVAQSFSFYGTKLTGVPVNRERWKRAVSLVEGSLGEALGEIYVEKYFPPAAKARMDELVANLIVAYRESIQNLSWMTDSTKAKAQTKLEKFTPKIGYPSKWRDYSKLEIRRDDLLTNVRNVNIFDHNREAAKIGSPIDREEWFMTSQTVNAYYNPGFNEIVFPAAILQPPFFSLDYDDAMNYGGIGAVIGHEIGHGFDDQGSKYDGDGALNNWWTDEDRKAFENLTGSLIDQYNALSPAQLDDSHKVNGEFTIGENIGDLGGLGIAYKAYKSATAGQVEEIIDGMTADQRFFASWAEGWRTLIRDEQAIQYLAIDPHSPDEFRCNQVVRNLDSFHEAFDTKPTDALWLDPADRVNIW